MSNRAIAGLADLYSNQVGMWRSRALYGEFGRGGLEDEARHGRLGVYSHDDLLLFCQDVDRARA